MEWNWVDGRAASYGPAGAIGKLIVMRFAPPAAYVCAAETLALYSIRYRNDPSACNGVLAMIDTALVILPLAQCKTIIPGGLHMRGGGVPTLSAAQAVRWSPNRGSRCGSV